MPTIEEFRSFFKDYENACRNRDAAFLKQMLPADIEDDQFEFVLDMSHQSTLLIDNAGIQPTIQQHDHRFDVIYEGNLGDDMTELVLDFYYSEGRWLKYNPDE